MAELVGIIGAAIFGISCINQAFTVVRSGNASSYSWLSLILWLIGSTCTIYYYDFIHNWLGIIGSAVNYTCNFSILLVKVAKELFHYHDK